MRPIFVAFDTETTGLEPESCEICEIAGVKFRIGEDGVPVYLGQYTSLVKIEGSVPPHISVINNIYDSMLVDAPPPKEAIGGFFRWAGPSAILLAHHAAFDVSFCGYAIRDYELMMPKNPVFCTKRMACKLMPGRHRLKDLEEALLAKDERWKKLRDDSQRHRALYDCYLLMHVFASMIGRGVPVEDLQDVKATMARLEGMDGARRAFDAPMDSQGLKMEFDDMKRSGVK